MKSGLRSTLLLAAAAAVALSTTPAFASDASDSSGGYKFSNFWGDVPAQQVPSNPVTDPANAARLGTYTTQTSRGTWIFAPDANAGANS